MQRERLRQKHQRKSLKRLLIFIILVLIILGIIIFIAQSPMRQAKHQSISIAKKEAGITKVNDFYSSNLNHTYYTISGSNQQNHKQYIIIDKSNGKFKAVNMSHSLSRNNIINKTKLSSNTKKILNVAPSIFNNQPVWIVSYLNNQDKLCYNTIDFYNGKAIQTISNI